MMCIEDIFEIYFISRDMKEHIILIDEEEKDVFVKSLNKFFNNKKTSGLQEIFSGQNCEIKPPIKITSEDVHLPKHSMSGYLFFICSLCDKERKIYDSIRTT